MPNAAKKSTPKKTKAPAAKPRAKASLKKAPARPKAHVAAKPKLVAKPKLAAKAKAKPKATPAPKPEPKSFMWRLLERKNAELAKKDAARKAQGKSYVEGPNGYADVIGHGRFNGPRRKAG